LRPGAVKKRVRDGGVAASRAGERPAGAARSPPAQKKERKGPALTHGAFFVSVNSSFVIQSTSQFCNNNTKNKSLTVCQ